MEMLVKISEEEKRLYLAPFLPDANVYRSETKKQVVVLMGATRTGLRPKEAQVSIFDCKIKK